MEQKTIERTTLPIWGRKAIVQATAANVPDNFLRTFAKTHPADVRKFGEGKNGTLLFRIEAVLAEIEKIGG